MLSTTPYRRLTRAAMLLMMAMAIPAGAQAMGKICAEPVSHDIPKRPYKAPSGTTLMKTLMNTGGTERDRAITDEVLAGNVPGFLRDLTPVTIWGSKNGQPVAVTICVTPGYLSVGNDRDYVQVPLGLTAAAHIASELGFYLPTPKMVDSIYEEAIVQVSPSPMKPTSEMESTDYLVRHNKTVQSQLMRVGGKPKYLTAGHKKDIVLTKRLTEKRGRVAIYGWHRTNGKPIQPLSTVHGAEYADYSHGVRLVSSTAYLNGKRVPLAKLMKDPDLARLLTTEGPMDPNRLMASLR